METAASSPGRRGQDTGPKTKAFVKTFSLNPEVKTIARCSKRSQGLFIILNRREDNARQAGDPERIRGERISLWIFS